MESQVQLRVFMTFFVMIFLLMVFVFVSEYRIGLKFEHFASVCTEAGGVAYINQQGKEDFSCITQGTKIDPKATN